MQKSAVISTENVYQIKAPLATFDTVDLGDEDVLDWTQPSSLVAETITEVVESTSSSASDSNKDLEVLDENNHCVQNGKDKKQDDVTSDKTSAKSDTASDYDTVNFGLFKKRKNIDSSVQYERIENGSTPDLSDQEKSLKELSFDVKGSSLSVSDSESSDSDSGYVRSGYISVSKGVITQKIGLFKHVKVPVINDANSPSDSELTPTNSPNLRTRVPLPLPTLSDEDKKIRSKRKAYEKKLQRLQVTTNPIERPRSTTPISVFGLEEYASFSSPEKSPASTKLEKLKIKLPSDEFGAKHKETPKRGSKSEGHNIFDFSEEKLYTRTRAALLVQSDCIWGTSPKRVLIPPTLSPATSRKISKTLGSTGDLMKNSPEHIYDPVSDRLGSQKIIQSSNISPSWVTFDDASSSRPLPITQTCSEESKEIKKGYSNEETNFTDFYSSNVDFSLDHADEILTVSFEEKADGKTLSYVHFSHLFTFIKKTLKATTLVLTCSLWNQGPSDLGKKLLFTLSHFTTVMLQVNFCFLMSCAELSSHNHNTPNPV
ncbi:hypothetical protein CHS0354_040122 [Potamilus streckersoni]|uniref:Uncharacterized protein n=1 Tax=Potamilus streckersoni TaxID=2493646 RepID=A0AAE0SSN5_9BIVA|nr:hypothetical protein CHS0354_040122 [Potamilus streckersoni]